RMVLLGHRTAGKSASADSILGLNESATLVGRTTRCQVRHARHLGREIKVVDTPGWWANASVEDTGKLRHLLPLLDGYWNRTLVLVTHGECLAGRAAEQYIQGAGQGLWALLEKCSNRYHVLCNKSKDGTQVRELLLKIEEMLAGNCLEKRQ
uniref:AIG1-type G domain-containing protein n=1 Tax=Gadus morhua TaxID=8049 RepID=A0A8C5D067_GADMO